MMSKTICSQESVVAEAVRTGQWNESLEAHAAGCARCREVMHTARAMQSLAFPLDQDNSMPEASRIWCLALLEQRQRETARARRSLAAAEFAFTALLVLASAGGLAWSWPELQLQLTAWEANLWPQLWQAAWFLVAQSLMLASLPAVPVLLLLLAVAAYLLAQPLLAED